MGEGALPPVRVSFSPRPHQVLAQVPLHQVKDVWRAKMERIPLAIQDQHGMDTKCLVRRDAAKKGKRVQWARALEVLVRRQKDVTC